MKNLKFITVIFAIAILGCQKDNGLKIEQNPLLNIAISRGALSIAQAQVFFEAQFSGPSQAGQILASLKGDEECAIVVPMWFLASEINTFEGNSLVIVPLDIKGEEVLEGRGMQMAFYTNEFDEIETEVVLYEAEGYDETRPYPLDNSHFSGFVNAINVNEKMSRLFPVQNGEVLGMIEMEPLQEGGLGGGKVDGRDDTPLLSFLCEWFGIGCGGCNNAGALNPGQGWVDIWNAITNFLSGNGGSGSGGSGGSSTFWLGYSYSGFPFYNYGNGGESSGGGSSANPAINTIFDGTFFNGEGQAVANKLEGIVADHDLMICTETLHEELYHCIAMNQAGDPLPPTGSGNQSGPDDPYANPSELNISAYIYELNALINGTSTECLSEVIAEYQAGLDLSEGDGMLMCAIQDNNNFDISDAGLFELIKEHCGSNGDCIDGLFECFNRLDNFQQEYDVVLSEAIINQIMSSTPEDICEKGSNEFEEYLINALVEEAENGSTVIELDENEEVVDVAVGILPYSCKSFVLENVSEDTYKTTITWWEPTFVDFSLIPLRYKEYSFRISFDIRITALPGELECDIKNQLANALNSAFQETVSYIGFSREYRLPNAQNLIEEGLEYNLYYHLTQAFPLSAPEQAATVPSSFALGLPLIPAIPGQVDDCCN